MWGIVSAVLGGIGLFLLGMILMTDALKALAGGALRDVLARFTGNRFSAVFTGAAVTAIVQSSSATTLATIGFVSAGLLSFQSAVGVILGANIGTTSTGWLVGLLGLKLSVGKLLLPVIGLGALAKLISRGRLAHVGSALAGFGVIFVGIDMLQAGMQDLAGVFRPQDFPAATLGGRLLLLGLGAGMTVVMQSSSAAVATTLAALSGGAIDLQQAAALVVGQNVGTTVTAGIAAIGATAAAKRTAAVHVLFNLGTALVIFWFLPWVVVGIQTLAAGLWGDDATLTLAAFHTVFNVVGLAVFLPFSNVLATLAVRLIPERRSRFTTLLDQSLLELPTVAVETAQRAQGLIASELLALVSGLLRGVQPPPGLVDELDVALDDVRHFVAQVQQAGGKDNAYERRLASLHMNEHLERLVRDAREVEHLQAVASQADLGLVAGKLADLLADLARGLATGDVQAEPIRDFSQRLSDEQRTARPAILEATAARTLDPDLALAALAAQRWVDRLAHHAWRCAHHARGTTP
jgi:phosphate:Na+ symporter